MSGVLHNGLRFKEDIEDGNVLVVGIVAPLDVREDVDAGQRSSARLQTLVRSNVFKVRWNGDALRRVDLSVNFNIILQAAFTSQSSC